ncbi:hypothetical protein [Paenibacillus humicus]|uniref:hypothetical protein n=1 Tax=Paenibacillus humicus TaxID=412861 RepID=UPI000FDCD878|nr:hypothetical protein [Paenibacillus humicus]
MKAIRKAAFCAAAIMLAASLSACSGRDDKAGSSGKSTGMDAAAITPSSSPDHSIGGQEPTESPSPSASAPKPAETPSPSASTPKESGSPSPSASAPKPAASGKPSASPSTNTATAAPALGEKSLTAYFGFADETGTKLMIVPDIQGEIDPDALSSIKTAAGAGGKTLPVAYAGVQQGDAKDNGRQTASNFVHMKGYVFQVEQGTAQPNATYYMLRGEQAPEAFFPVEDRKAAKPDASLLKAIAQEKKRKVDQAWTIGRIDVNGKPMDLLLIQFAREQKSMLASLVLVPEKSKPLYKDFPADYDENSTWTVDDGGTMNPDSFSLRFAARTVEGMILGMEWNAAEGSNSFLLQADSGKLADLGIGGGRYMSP